MSGTDNKEQMLREEYIELADKKRKEWAQSDAVRDVGITEPEGVRKITDISYAESENANEKKWHLMDIYYPEEEQKNSHPVIVSVHGGGWFYGDKELYKPYTMTLAACGFAVVNFNYRLSPENQYPAGFMDVCSLMDYLSRHAEEYSLNLDSVYMVGDSAGAQLASQYCIYATNQSYQDLFPFSEHLQKVVPKKIALNCGVYDLGALLGEDEMCDWYLPYYMEKNTAISFFKVLEFMTTDFPPTYLMLSVNDALAKNTEPIKNRLEKLGIPLVYREFGQDEKSDGHVFHLNLRSKNGQAVNREEIEFFGGNV